VDLGHDTRTSTQSQAPVGASIGLLERIYQLVYRSSALPMWLCASVTAVYLPFSDSVFGRVFTRLH
jgi:hypothetical protein